MANKKVKHVTYRIEKQRKTPVGRLDVYFFLLVFVFVSTLVTTHVLLGVYAI